MADSTIPTDNIIQAESGGNPNAQNPNSSASGPGQFIDSTFLSVLKAHHPEIANGQTDAQLLGMKNDPTLGRQLTSDYAADNQAYLKQNGQPVTPGTTYLAHFAGPGGALKILQADPGTPAGDVLGQSAVAANPFLKGMTAAGLQAWAAKKMGTASPIQPQQAAGGAPGTPQAPPAPPIQPQQQPVFAAAPAAPPAAPVAIPGAPPPPTLFAQQRKPIDLSGLRAALAARAPIFPNQGQV